MRLRYVKPEIGSTVTVRDATAYTLPSGLEQGASVTVLGQDGRITHHVRRESDGAEFRVPYQCVDLEHEYEIRDGRWIHESHPKILDWLERQLVGYRTDSSLGIHRETLVEDTARRLRKYGREVPP